MLNLTPGIKIYVYTPVTDLRKGFDGLSGIVRREFEADPTDGSLFVFINRRRDRMKILHFDGGGFWLYYRLLEAGTFEGLTSQDEQLQSKDEQLDAKDVELRSTDIQRQEREQKLDKLTQDYETLQLAYNKLLQQRFGNRSERYINDPDQLRLDFGDTDEAAETATNSRSVFESDRCLAGSDQASHDECDLTQKRLWNGAAIHSQPLR